jgi:hypothetical protein
MYICDLLLISCVFVVGRRRREKKRTKKKIQKRTLLKRRDSQIKMSNGCCS